MRGLSIKRTIVTSVFVAIVCSVQGAAIAQLDPPGTVVYRVNAGGGDYTDSFGKFWFGDSNYNTGKTNSGGPVAGTADSFLYESERWDRDSLPELTYSFPVDPGTYNVRLHFAEIYSGIDGPGQRVFGIDIEGVVVAPSVDIYDLAGFATAYFMDFSVPNTDGVIDITFLHQVENPKISAIAIASDPQAATAEVTPTSIDFGALAVGLTSDPTPVELMNSGDEQLDVTAISIGGSHIADFATDATPPYSLQPGESVFFNATFSPQAEGGRSASINITSNDPNSPTQLPLTGTGVVPLPPDLDVTPGLIDFGDVGTGTPSEGEQLDLTNAGEELLTVTAVDVIGTHPGDFETDAVLPIDVGAGETVSLTVTFTPQADGPRSGQLQIASNDAESPHLVDLAGNGVPPLPPTANVSPVSIDFGAHALSTPSVPVTVTVTNTGDADLEVSTISLMGSHPGDFSTNEASPYTIPPSQSETFDVTFTASALGARSASIEIQSNDPASPAQVPLAGEGVDLLPPQLDTTPGSVDFGNVNIDTLSDPEIVTLTNLGEQDLIISSAAIEGPNASEFYTNAAPMTIGPGLSAGVEVAFLSSSTGPHSADLVFISNDPASPTVVSLSAIAEQQLSVLYRVNAGGSQFVDVNGDTWSDDSPFVNTGKTGSTTAEIIGTNLDPMYQSERWDRGALPEMNYSFPVENGDYLVRAHFAEIYEPNGEVGARVFDVMAENVVVVPNLDIFAVAGLNTAHVEEFPVNVGDSVLDIEFIHGVENPKVSGIEVMGGAAGSPNLDINPTSVDFGDVVSESGQSFAIVTLTNTGLGNLLISSLAIEGTDADQFSHDGAPAYFLTPGQSTDVAVTFTPTRLGAASAQFNLQTNLGGAPISVPLSGNGSEAGVPSTAPGSIDFGDVLVGDISAPTTVTMTNNDVVSHEVHAITIEGVDNADFVISNTPTLPVTLDSGMSITADVAFQPLAAGARSGELRFHMDSHTVHATSDLSGVGQVEIPEVAIIRLNAGGGEYTDTEGNTWLADEFYVNTGNIYSTSNPIANTDDAPLYQTERWDRSAAPEMLYSIMVDNGTYLVRLHFAEIAADGDGARIFDVHVEGQPVLENFDIHALVGKYVAHVEEVTATVSDGSLDIEFLHLVENPKISAIEVLLPTSVEIDQALLDWGHVLPGEIGETKTFNLSNPGTADTLVEGMNFLVNQGSGEEFSVTIGGMTYDGASTNISHPLSVPIPAGGSVPVDVVFSPTTYQSNDITLEFTGGFPTVDTRLRGTGGEETGHPFLHVVINIEPPFVDYDGSGFEDVTLRGDLSHTHEFGQNLVTFEWREGGDLLSTSPNTVLPFGLGEHTVDLTIYDDNVPPETLTGSATFTVTSADAVLGPLALYYPAGAGTANDLLDAVPGAAEFAEQLIDGFLVEQSDLGTVGKSPYVGNVMVRLIGEIDVTTSATYDFRTVGGNETRLFVGGVPHSGPTALTPGVYELEARFAVASTTELPLVVETSVDGGGFVPVAELLSTTHDETLMPPVINSMTGSGLITGGNTIVIDGLGFFPSGDVEVNWGGTVLSGPDFTSVEADRITFPAPAGSGTIGVFVETSKGQSNTKSYQYLVDGPAPIEFNVSTAAASISGPTTGVWGPDHRYYVGTVGGTIVAYTFDDAYNVVDTQIISTLEGLTNKNILGITVNPFDPPSPVKLYVAHNELFANGGACFEGFSPYSGQISVLTGPNFDTIEPLVTGLPVSNHDHGINGLEFDNNGDLLVASGGNTNAGVAGDCEIGQIPESPLTGAILKFHTSRPNFNGAVQYIESDTCIVNDDQVFGNIVELARGIDVSVFAPGLRNTYELTLTTSGHIYATDNGPNGGFGPRSLGPDTQGTDPSVGDEILLVDIGRYYGHPNRNRGRFDERQYIYRSRNTATIEGEYTSPIANASASTNGIIEYRSATFSSAMRGDLITQRWNDVTNRVVLDATGTSVTQIAALTNDMTGLDLSLAPGGVILGADYSGNRIAKAVPNDSAAVGVTVYDIFPWRAPASGGHPFAIGGANFGTLSDTSVTIGGIPATLTAVRPTRIEGIIPANATPTHDLQDVEVTVDGISVTLTGAFLYLDQIGPSPDVSAKVIIDPPSGGILNASTFGSNSFKVENTSSNGRTIKRVRIDLSTAVFPDAVYDPDGLAGDTVGKGFQQNSGLGTGLTDFIYFNPHDDGWDVLELQFNDFEPGETIGFSIDIDPTTTRGTAQPGPGESASVSGMELSGAHVYIEFDDGSILEGDTFVIPGSVKGSEVALSASPPETVEISSPSVACKNETVSDASQIITVTGTPGTDVRLMHVEAALFVENGGFDVDPFEFNTALQINEISATIGAGGTVDIPVTLTNSDPDAGYNVFAAVADEGSAATGMMSEVLVMHYVP